MAYNSKQNRYKYIVKDDEKKNDDTKHDKKDKNRNDNKLKIEYNAMTTTQEIALRTHQHPAHVYHTVSWAKYMNQQRNNKNASKIRLKILESNKDAFTLNNIFSMNECKKLIYLSECHGYATLLSASKGGKWRTNTRIITDDKSLSNLLYQRIKMFLPKTYKINNQIWEICGLNERFRFCKYIKGQQFNIHHDKRLELTKENKASFYTVNIYLNNGLKEYEGGKTIFYERNINGSYKQYKWKQSSYVIGRPGLALIFNHFPQKYKHCGETLISGTKYITRTDVMYKLKKISRKQQYKQHKVTRW